MAKEVKILSFDLGPRAGRMGKSLFAPYTEYSEIEAEIGRYLADGYSVVSSSIDAGSFFVTLQR